VLAGATVAIAGCSAVATVLVLLESPSTTLGDLLTRVFGVVAAALFLGAGVLRVSRWRIAGDPRSLMMGAALIVLGGLALPLTSLAGVIMDGSTTSMLRAVTALTSTLVTLTLVVRALNTPAEDASLRPLRVVGPAATTATAIFAGLVVVYVWAPGLLTSTLVPPPMIRGALLATAWFVVGLEAAMRSPQLPWAGRVAPLMGCMAVAELLRVISVVHPGAWEVTGSALVAVIASLTAHRALLDLDEAACSEQQDLEPAPEAPPRNALGGLRAALTTLEEYGARLDSTTKERLRAAALGEVSHLEHLLIRGEPDETVDFDLEPVLRTVVETRRAMGTEIELSDCDLRAHGRPGDVATVLRNLLENAEQHGAGPVTVTVLPLGERIEIHVTDHGPGMPASQVATLFQRGARGTGSVGSGLGLHVSHALMQQQGGDLELGAHTGGCTFILSLWGCGGPTPVAMPYQRLARRTWPRAADAVPAD
jgi:signal transduction histidine kinase